MSEVSPVEQKVRQHIHWVRSSALRITGDAKVAEDVTAAVFILIAERSRGRDGAGVLEELFRATRACAAAAMKQRKAPGRRAGSADSGDWEIVAPRLDDCVAAMDAEDRNAILLRFYQNQPMQEVSDAMGVDLAAAKRRVYRAVDELREALARRGVAIAASALAALLSEKTTSPAPAKSIEATLAAVNDPARAPAARALASDVSKQLAWRKATWAAIAIVGAAACMAGIWLAIHLYSPHGGRVISGPIAQARPATAPIKSMAKSPSTAPVAGTLKVGVYLSKYTGKNVGYSCQMTDEILRHGLDVFPILDPGSEGEPAIVKLRGVYFPGRPSVNATDAGALGTLDVIVAPRIWMLRDDARQAIESAVRRGTGLLIRDGLGCMVPGDGADISRLNGFIESSFGYNPHPMECEVIGQHPILGNLSGTTGTIILITPNGTWGVPDAQMTPLVRVKDMAAFRKFVGGDESWIFYPLYVGKLGKGRIVGCQFPAWERLPKDLAKATDGEFNLRAVKWVAKSADAERSETTTQPTTSVSGS